MSGVPSPLYSVTDLDANQVLKYSYDEAKQRIRVDADLSVTGPTDLEVAIVHTEDSVRLGDGTNFITSTTEDAKVAVDVSLIPSQSPIAATPLVVNVASALINTEYSYTFSANTKKILIKPRIDSNVKFSYISGQSGTTFITIPKGNTFSLDQLNLNGVTIYFQTDKPSNTLEILAWT
jgi:hypothetical protein